MKLIISSVLFETIVLEMIDFVVGLFNYLSRIDEKLFLLYLTDYDAIVLFITIELLGMGVVIQEMVDSETAGVLFTVDPKNGNPSRMILTANYGLGESVVSAIAEPDTFIVKRTSSGALSVLEKTIGSKLMKVVLTENGTRQQEMDKDASQSSCLSDEMALQLAQLGLHLEQCFGGPRDIEFAIRNNRIYLLQVNTFKSSSIEFRKDFNIVRISVIWCDVWR